IIVPSGSPMFCIGRVATNGFGQFVEFVTLGHGGQALLLRFKGEDPSVAVPECAGTRRSTGWFRSRNGTARRIAPIVPTGRHVRVCATAATAPVDNGVIATPVYRIGPGRIMH